MTIFTSPLPAIAVPDVTITERLFQGLNARPDRVVLIDGPSGRSLTGAALMEGIRRMAGGLTAAGYGAGHVVALMAPNMPEYCTVFHGVAWAGGTITTINPTYTEHELRHQLNDSRAELLITIPDFLPIATLAVAGTAVRQIAVIGHAAGATPLDAFMGEPLADQVPVDLDGHIVVLPYSSGTTGLPKGVMLSQRNLTVNVDQSMALIEVREGEVTVAFLPFFHIYGMNVMMNLFLTGGATLVTMPRFDLPALLGHVQTHRVRQIFAVPPVAMALAKHPLIDQFDLSSLEVVVSAAAPLGSELADACGARLNCVAVQGYGMTEMSPVSHFTSARNARSGAVGLTVPNTECRILDIETGAPLPAGQEGELCIRGPQVMKGYLNNPEATARTIDADGWLHTGDVAMFDADGFLFIRDRLKELIKYKGFQVAPAEVEAVLQSHPAIADAAVIGLPDDEAGEVPMAFIVPAPGTVPDLDAIRAHVADRLSSYKRPQRIDVIDAIPKSASGKILRRILRERVKAA
ncbi:AMP-binding protein [Fertoebacter nigrum]|uniref:AMP-binding protein n=1 Tax=Fertoeibacter niger TaxID=2656921 RepID=A0A8X8H3I9_9RHOB|nr:AMP-binding protein [Fertoeibacter niger]NUB46676.1 AMP-binding protein [Fertoeibacter niger]